MTATMMLGLPVVYCQASRASMSASSVPPFWPVVVQSPKVAEARIVGRHGDLDAEVRLDVEHVVAAGVGHHGVGKRLALGQINVLEAGRRGVAELHEEPRRVVACGIDLELAEAGESVGGEKLSMLERLEAARDSAAGARLRGARDATRRMERKHASAAFHE